MSLSEKNSILRKKLFRKSNTPSNTYLKKICVAKCKNCKGEKCPNYFGHKSKRGEYYGGVLHSKKILFSGDVKNKKNFMDKQDWQLVYLLIAFTIILTILGAFLP